ncbi:uncharacterized protein K452DRAFT_241714 [Aplosporella prunicola CBS 121167]|uniref:Golgi apparatus membrane protein TVP38 n=1 Tax=Aplosporella prunicola CBS 121167 TaxID=1176127 RepID=A0A6A6BSC4_9PEZI|nr:uncharacterized protein K452DRAFT_241714 [Aplosporella prunicola CBS 121167]KAF2146698.1 hypothetical protein K452DRAFT_241714 [Aplosporella prunicola CBS 121167]
MPASDEYDVRALALPIDSPPSEHRRSFSPTWQRQRRHRSSSAALLSPVAGASATTGLRATAEKLQRQGARLYARLTPLQRALLAVAGLGAMVFGVLFLVYNERIFGYLAPLAARWREVKGGWLVLWFMTFFVSFPPLIGYSTCVTLAGFVYGFPNGWFIVASATIFGSTASFLTTRLVLHRFVSRLIANDSRFAALALTLKHDGLKLLIMIRLCPLPYSLSNGAIATFPTVHWAAFMFATALVSPKLLLHVFVGAKIGELAEHGGEMDAKTKAISYVSIVIGLAAGVLTGWLMYRQTSARAAELEQEERDAVRGHSRQEVGRDYADDPEAGAAAEVLREAEDDISLHTEAYYADAAEIGSYHDEEGEDGAQDDVFDAGDGLSTDDEGRK